VLLARRPFVGPVLLRRRHRSIDLVDPVIAYGCIYKRCDTPESTLEVP
jgi:hypothetical protein